MSGCSGPVCAILLLAGPACAHDIDDTPGYSTWEGGYPGIGYSGTGYYGYPGYGAWGYIDPGYAASLGTISANPLYDIGGYGLYGLGWDGYGYPGYGLSGYGYPGFDYGPGPGAHGDYASPYSESGVSGSVDQRYIRQLEERIRKLEKAGKQSLKPYSERSSQWAVSPRYSDKQPAYQEPWSGYYGQSGNPWSRSWQDNQGEYPTYQPSYGGPPTYRFRQ
ncbi:MAG: hypothetical protein PVJ15_00995 [Gammaproteobacteria bacterium]|jgi:hypothetical protein